MKAQSVVSPRVALIESQEDGNAGGVIIARIADPETQLAGRPRRFHDDVIDSLVELTVALLDEEFSGEGANR